MFFATEVSKFTMAGPMITPLPLLPMVKAAGATKALTLTPSWGGLWPTVETPEMRLTRVPELKQLQRFGVAKGVKGSPLLAMNCGETTQLPKTYASGPDLK